MMKFIMTKVLFFFSIFILFSKILISNVFAAPTFVHGFSVNSQETNPAGLAFSSDGTKMFHVGNIFTGNHAKTNADVFEYALSTPWDVCWIILTKKKLKDLVQKNKERFFLIKSLFQSI